MKMEENKANKKFDIKSLLNKFTIYQYMISFLIILQLVSVFFYGFGVKALLPVFLAVITTVALDLIIEYFKSKTFFFPQSALISGLFIGSLLTQNLQWYVYVIAGAIAILSKHLIRVFGKHIFNPANFGVLIVTLVPAFNAFDSWWISSPKILVVLFGIFIIWRLRRFDLSLSFLVTYYIVNSIILVPRGMMAHHSYMMAYHDIYLTVVEGSVIYFFSMFMLIEPKTHPKARNQRIFYGMLIAIMFVGLQVSNSRHDLIMVLAIANLFVPLLNRLKFEFKKKEVQDQPQPSASNQNS